VVDGGSVVVNDYKLVDASKLSDQRLAEQRLNLADQILRTDRLTAASTFTGYRLCHDNNNLRVCYRIIVEVVFVICVVVH